MRPPEAVITDQPGSDPVSVEKASAQSGRFGFLAVLSYLGVEYLRPMDILPALAAVRPGLLTTALIVVALLARAPFRTVFRSSRQTVYLWLFVLLLMAYVPLAVNNFRAYQQALAVLLYVPCFLGIVAFVDSLARLRHLLICGLVATLYIGVNGTLGGGIGGSSFLADENDFSLLVNMMLPFAICLVMYDRGWVRATALVASVVAIAAVVASFSRGGFLGLLAVFIVLWSFSERRVLTAFVVVALAGMLAFFAGSAFWQEMGTIGDTNTGTANERLLSWKAAWNMFKAHPLGVGGGNFPIFFDDYKPAEMTKSMWGRPAHSLWFTLLPELGVLGVVIYFKLLGRNLRDLLWLRRLGNRDDERLRYLAGLAPAFFASLAGYFVSGTFLSVLYYPHYFYLTALIVAVCRIADARQGAIAVRGS